jgi:hypothetical protein
MTTVRPALRSSLNFHFFFCAKVKFVCLGRPNYCVDMMEYYEEIHKAVDILRQRDGIEKILFYGHGSGTLSTLHLPACIQACYSGAVPQIPICLFRILTPL